MASYPYKISTDDNGTLLITFPDFPEAATWAKDLDEAERRAQDAIDTAIAGRISDRESIPVPRAAVRNHSVVVSALRATKVALWNLAREQEVTKAQLARSLGMAPAQVDRMFDPRHASAISQLEAAAGALGAGIAVTVTKDKSGKKAVRRVKAA